MIHWSVLDDLYKSVKEKYPNLSDDEQFEIACRAYKEIDYKVLMGDGTGKPVGIFTGTYPQKIQNKE